MREPARPGPLVEVEWIDAGGQQGWHEAARSTDPLHESGCVSAGYLLQDDEDGVVLVMGVNAGGLQHDSLTIPRAMVKRVLKSD